MPPTREANAVNWRMVRACMCAVSAGINKNPNAISGPTLSTAIETVSPISRRQHVPENNVLAEYTCHLAVE